MVTITVILFVSQFYCSCKVQAMAQHSMVGRANESYNELSLLLGLRKAMSVMMSIVLLRTAKEMLCASAPEVNASSSS